MQIPLHAFEQYIDETILARGLQYFKKGLVNEPEEIAHGQYEATVEGSEVYTVRLTIKNETVTDYVCTCPYDMGPVCKHVAAVIFYLQQIELNLTAQPSQGKKAGQSSPKKKTIAEQVDEVLHKMSHSDLKEYIKEQCDKDSTFRQLFLAKFAYLVIPDSKALYAKQIKAILKSAMGRGGYIEYSEARHAGRDIYEIVQTAEKQVEAGNYQTAMYMAWAVLEEMTAALEFADDSSGDIGGCIEPAVEVLFSLSNQPLSDTLQNELFEYCITAFQKGTFKGWDWHFSMLDLASELAQTTEHTKQINALLDTVKPNNSDWDWDIQKAQRIRLQLIRKTEGEEKAIRFMEQNLGNSDFRKEAIERAISTKDYDKAIALSEEGVKKDEKDKPGLADNWREYLLNVYTLLKETDNMIKYARYLFLNSNREKKGYFDILKKQVSPQNWNDFVEGLINNIRQKNRWVDYNSIAQIYIWEERWNDLLGIVKQNATLNSIETYEKYLSTEYADELTSLYQTAILKYMETNINRDYYQEACRYLRRVIKLGARDKANYVIKMLQTLYPKRKALMEELQKV